MRVVVTRPEISAVRTAGRLKTMGHDPILMPLFRPIHDLRATTEALQKPHCALAATSAETLRLLSAQTLRPLIDAGKPFFAVGAATADAARSLGYLNVRTGEGDGADLADLISSDFGEAQDPVLYLAGQPRAGTLEGRLQESGIPCTVAEIYRMQAIDYSPEELADRLEEPSVGAVLLYSRETALRFFDILPPSTAIQAGLRILCLSEQVASGLPAAFRHRAEIAQSPNENALLALL